MNIKFLNSLAMGMLILAAGTATASYKKALAAAIASFGSIAAVYTAYPDISAKQILSSHRSRFPVIETTGDMITWNIIHGTQRLSQIEKNCEYQSYLANEPQSPEITARIEELKAKNALLIQKACNLLETLPDAYRQKFDELPQIVNLKSEFGVDVLAQCKEIGQPK